MRNELNEIEEEAQKEKEAIVERLKVEKQDRLSEFEDRLKAAGSQKEFN